MSGLRFAVSLICAVFCAGALAFADGNTGIVYEHVMDGQNRQAVLWLDGAGNGPRRRFASAYRLKRPGDVSFGCARSRPHRRLAARGTRCVPGSGCRQR